MDRRARRVDRPERVPLRARREPAAHAVLVWPVQRYQHRQHQARSKDSRGVVRELHRAASSGLALFVLTEETLDIHDIPGLVRRGYGTLTAARFLLLAVVDEERARTYLQGLCSRINLARDSPETFAIQVAFTRHGLERLGVPDSAVATFSREFLEGMDDDVRADTLGDRGDNDPSTWQWGRRSEPVDVLLMVYALDDDTLKPHVARELDAIAGGFRVLHDKSTASLDDKKEHFGWTDGISM